MENELYNCTRRKLTVECLTLLTVTCLFDSTTHPEAAPKPLLHAGKIVIYADSELSQITSLDESSLFSDQRLEIELNGGSIKILRELNLK